MRDQEILGLQEAYSSIYAQPEEQEIVSEDLQQNVGKALDAAAKNPVIKAIGKVIAPVGPGKGTVTKAEQEKKVKGNVKEEVDIFDVILEHLVAEGYADTNEAALVIMANMSEEWRESIIEEVLDEKKYGPDDKLPSGKTPQEKMERKSGYHSANYMLRGRETRDRNDQARTSHFERASTINRVKETQRSGEEPHTDPKWKNTIAARRRPRGQGEVPNERPGGLRANKTKAGGYRTLKRKED